MTNGKKIGFKQTLSDFLKVLKSQNLEETIVIDEEDIVKSLVILNFISYEKIADVFLGCACLNLINRYVKNNSSKLNYQFKRHINNLLKGIEDIHQPKTIKVDYDNSENKAILLISIWDFQFSFKSIRFSRAIEQILHSKSNTFDGIRKQPYALTIFRFAWDNEFISNRTLSNKDLREFVNDE